MGAPSLGIEEAIRAAVAKEIYAGNRPTNRASELGHDCLRYLVYCRTDNDKRLLHDAGLELIFREGRLHEPAVVRLLEDSGFEVIEAQRTFQDREVNISGHIDGKLLVQGKAYAMEIKSMSPHTFERVIGMDDPMKGMREAKEPWLRKYPAQITAYMALDHEAKVKAGTRQADEPTEGIFVLKNKVNGRVIDRLVDLDDEYWKALRYRAEAVNFHCEAGSLPGRLDNSEICMECAFRHVCLPEVDFGSEADFIRALEPLLDRRDELKEWKKNDPRIQELAALEAELKRMVKGRNKIIAGRWRGKGTDVDVKERVVKAYSYTRWSWKKVDPPADQATN